MINILKSLYNFFVALGEDEDVRVSIEEFNFCSDCLHYNHFDAKCHHESNIIYKITPIKAELKFKETPEDINYNNRCKNYNEGVIQG